MYHTQRSPCTARGKRTPVLPRQARVCSGSGFRIVSLGFRVSGLGFSFQACTARRHLKQRFKRFQRARGGQRMLTQVVPQGMQQWMNLTRAQRHRPLPPISFLPTRGLPSTPALGKRPTVWAAEPIQGARKGWMRGTRAHTGKNRRVPRILAPHRERAAQDRRGRRSHR